MIFWIITIAVISPANAHAATAGAANLVVDILARQVSDRSAPGKQLCLAVMPMYGIAWGRKAIGAGATDRLNKICCILRQSQFRRNEYGRFTAFLKSAPPASSFPPELGEWRAAIERFRLDAVYGWDALLAVRTQIRAIGTLPPRRINTRSTCGVVSFSIRFPIPSCPSGTLVRGTFCGPGELGF